MDLFARLEKKQHNTPFLTSDQRRFFFDNAGMLNEHPAFARYTRATKPFDIIRANIIIQSLLNKRAIERAFANARAVYKKRQEPEDREALIMATQEAIESLPYYQEGPNRIYLPIFPRTINRIYAGEFYRLDEKNIVRFRRNFEALILDPFDTYGPELYNSYFTKLVRVTDDKNFVVYYDYDACCLYVVNSQGRLENAICFFDTGIPRKENNHMMERALPVAEAYLKGDRDLLLKTLVEKKLISSKFVLVNKADEQKLYMKIQRDSERG